MAVLATSVVFGAPAAHAAEPCAATVSNTQIDAAVRFDVSFACPKVTVEFMSTVTPAEGVTCAPDPAPDVDVDPAGGIAELSWLVEQLCAGSGDVTADNVLSFRKNGTVMHQATSTGVFAASAILAVTGGGEVRLKNHGAEAHGFTSNDSGTGSGVSLSRG